MSFFYNIFGDYMKIYIDLLFFINFAFDFLLLLTTSIILKRNASINRILISSFIGGLSLLVLFININTIELFIFKIIISILMIIVAFSYKNIRYTIKNLLYFYTSSIVLGGFLYYLNIEFSYKHEGIIFYHNGLSINYIILIILSPIILYLYIRQFKSFKTYYNKYYEIKIYLDNNKIISATAYLDTGNTLCDPYFNYPVILLNKKKMIYDINEFGMILVPYKTITEENILNCIKVKRIDIKGVGIKEKVLLGLIEDNIKIDGIDCILNNKLMEG